MNPSLWKLVDGKIFEFRRPPQVVCNKHSTMAVHKHRVNNLPPSKVYSPEQYPLHNLTCAGSQNDNDNVELATSSTMDINIDNSSIPAPDHDVPVDSDSELVPISELWNAISSSRFYNLELNETGDLFDKLRCALTSGESLFPMPLTPMTEEIGFDDETESNFGIELKDDGPLNTKGCVNLNNPVLPDHPMYPWPSKAHFITALLFSSLRLPFSEAQKKAILSWAKELSALDVPSLYTLNHFQETVQKLVGNLRGKVTACSGNIFYLNDVGQAIAKDYANPLTRFAMQDYPEDGG
ncbi:hypothetical protein EV424DRAFT_1541382 [Suillus variegatus]|nr:hypothetical protein EV424DRAFT_1541382 [Suillus variegatus]